jgi:DNA-binding transcriptional MerR regulator
VEGTTIQEAAEESGWSPRMLRYLESLGLACPRRSPSGYRIYTSEQVRYLITLREMSERYEIDLRDAGFALRLRDDPFLRHALNDLLGKLAPRDPQTGHTSGTAWLQFEQAKHERLLALSSRRPSVADSYSTADNVGATETHDPTATTDKEIA